MFCSSAVLTTEWWPPAWSSPPSTSCRRLGPGWSSPSPATPSRRRSVTRRRTQVIQILWGICEYWTENCVFTLIILVWLSTLNKLPWLYSKIPKKSFFTESFISNLILWQRSKLPQFISWWCHSSDIKWSIKFDLIHLCCEIDVKFIEISTTTAAT